MLEYKGNNGIEQRNRREREIAYGTRTRQGMIWTKHLNHDRDGSNYLLADSI